MNKHRSAGNLVPRRVGSYHEFTDSILQLGNTVVALQPTESKEFINSACYLLGWFVGDLGKHYRNEFNMIVDIDIQLTRKHPENLVLGEYVARCIRRFGIRCKRTSNTRNFGYQRTISDNNPGQIPESNESLESIPC